MHTLAICMFAVSITTFVLNGLEVRVGGGRVREDERVGRGEEEKRGTERGI